MYLTPSASLHPPLPMGCGEKGPAVPGMKIMLCFLSLSQKTRYFVSLLPAETGRVSSWTSTLPTKPSALLAVQPPPQKQEGGWRATQLPLCCSFIGMIRANYGCSMAVLCLGTATLLVLHKCPPLKQEIGFPGENLKQRVKSFSWPIERTCLSRQS